MSSRIPTLVITPGDPAGIGPEVVWKTLRRFQETGELSRAKFLCVGAREPFQRLGAKIREFHAEDLSVLDTVEPATEPEVWLLAAPESAPRARFLPGYQSGWSIETATDLVQRGIADALVTGPISKARLKKGGFRFPGHTEFLAHLCKTKRVTPKVTMMLVNEKLRVTMVTTHIPLKKVSRHLTRERLRRTILHTVDHLRNWWGIPCPRVAVAGLNPHAGENGLLGKEDKRLIEPVVRALANQANGRYRLNGPIPSDTLFAKHHAAEPKDRFDAVVCMYHDQGLIPVKLLDFPNTVNVTLGLPIVRTSVDHGTGFDIAGKNLADPSSLQAAIRLAQHIVAQGATRER